VHDRAALCSGVGQPPRRDCLPQLLALMPRMGRVEPEPAQPVARPQRTGRDQSIRVEDAVVLPTGATDRCAEPGVHRRVVPRSPRKQVQLGHRVGVGGAEPANVHVERRVERRFGEPRFDGAPDLERARAPAFHPSVREPLRELDRARVRGHVDPEVPLAVRRVERPDRVEVCTANRCADTECNDSIEIPRVNRAERHQRQSERPRLIDHGLERIAGQRRGRDHAVDPHRGFVLLEPEREIV
jgi:hypothetical protein